MYEGQKSASFRTDEREPPPLRSEIAKAIAMKASTIYKICNEAKTGNGKAAGPDDIPAELFKKGGDTTLDELHALCKDIWETAEWPEEWTRPLPKKGNLCECGNYRTIALVSHTSKILFQVILNRIQAKAEAELSD